MIARRPVSLLVLALAGLAVAAAGPADAKSRRSKKAAPPPAASAEQPTAAAELMPGGALDLDLPMLLGDGPVRLAPPIIPDGAMAKPSESLERWYRRSVADKGARIVAAFSSGDAPQAGPGTDALMTPFRTIAVVDGEIGDRERRLPTERTVTINTAVAVPLAPGVRLGIGLDADLSGNRPDFIPTLGIAHRF